MTGLTLLARHIGGRLVNLFENEAEETGFKQTLLAHRMSHGEEKMTKPKVERQREKLWDKLLNSFGGLK